MGIALGCYVMENNYLFYFYLWGVRCMHLFLGWEQGLFMGGPVGSSGNEGYLLAYNQKSSIFILLVSQVCRVQLSISNIFTTLKQTSHSILSNLICEIELIAIQSLRLSLETFRLHGAASDSWFSRVCKPREEGMISHDLTAHNPPTVMHYRFRSPTMGKTL